MKLEFTSMVFKEGDMYVAFSPELDVSSCGRTSSEAKKNLREAVGLFIKETQAMGTLEDVLIEVGYTKSKDLVWNPPRLVSTGKMQLTTPA